MAKSMNSLEKQELICSVLQDLKKAQVDEVALVETAGSLLNRLYKHKSHSREAAAAAAREIVFSEWL
jgi:hypothetical protein